MKELSLNILDIAENSTKAKAELINIEIIENSDTLIIKISDNGIGMNAETLLSVTDPFYTTRTTRKVGMGIPLFRFAAEQTGGNLTISSRHIDEHPTNHGTIVSATFNKNHIDFTPLGDIVSTLVTMIQGHPMTDYVFTHRIGDGLISLDTREMRAVLDGLPLDTYEVLCWVKENLTEQYKAL
ncbi:MAG: sensor histidine kinase [Clostridia bacterium]|nr:sensor histidine kinase [Clostridia bacterium]